MSEMLLNILPFVFGLVLSLAILNRMRIFSSSGVFFSNPDDILDERKAGVVEIGGVAIFPILIMSLCLSLGMSRWLRYYELVDVELATSGDRILQVLAGCALLYIVGLKNDIHGTFGKTKFGVLLAASVLFPMSGLWVRSLEGLFGIYELSPWVGIPLTILLTSYLTEMIALLDDIDGLGIGLLAIMLSIFLGISIAMQFTLGMLITTAGLGICFPYACMKYFAPSWKKTLVGNAGSYPLGYVLSYAVLSLLHPAGIEMPSGILMIVIGVAFVPMLDLLRTIRLRVREGRSVHTPDRNLLQHRLIRMGVKPAVTPLVILIVIVFFAGLNTVWVLMHQNLTLLAVLDFSLWTMLQLLANYLIRRNEERQDKSDWVMTYGREAWEADVPVEKIRKKRKQFGSLGLAPEFVMGDETEFIPDGMNSFERNTKRVIDCMVAAVALVLTSPLFLLCYVLIKLDDGGDTIYRQERIGRFGRPFEIYKFRSMRPDAEGDTPLLSHAGGADDPRLTRVGRFLRAHHLDELPQLVNVLKGDMAFIGYRPERKFFIDQIMELDPRYSMLYQIRPGVTSYATLYNGYTDTIEKMLRRLNYDLYYLEHRSFGFDLNILWRTCINILFGRKF